MSKCNLTIAPHSKFTHCWPRFPMSKEVPPSMRSDVIRNSGIVLVYKKEGKCRHRKPTATLLLFPLPITPHVATVPKYWYLCRGRQDWVTSSLLPIGKWPRPAEQAAKRRMDQRRAHLQPRQRHPACFYYLWRRERGEQAPTYLRCPT